MVGSSSLEWSWPECSSESNSSPCMVSCEWSTRHVQLFAVRKQAHGVRACFLVSCVFQTGDDTKPTSRCYFFIPIGSGRFVLWTQCTICRTGLLRSEHWYLEDLQPFARREEAICCTGTEMRWSSYGWCSPGRSRCQRGWRKREKSEQMVWRWIHVVDPVDDWNMNSLVQIHIIIHFL